jgi:hypothetical protein
MAGFVRCHNIPLARRQPPIKEYIRRPFAGLRVVAFSELSYRFFAKSSALDCQKFRTTRALCDALNGRNIESPVGERSITAHRATSRDKRRGEGASVDVVRESSGSIGWGSPGVISRNRPLRHI